MATDYISRDKAIEIVINYEFENCPDYMRDFATKLKSAVCSDIRTDLQAIPAADVRPVVLCRDCKHFNPYPGDYTDGEIEGVCKRHNSIGVLVTDEDFCSDAGRI